MLYLNYSDETIIVTPSLIGSLNDKSKFFDQSAGSTHWVMKNPHQGFVSPKKKKKSFLSIVCLIPMGNCH